MMKYVFFQNSVSLYLNISTKRYVKSISKEGHVIVPRNYIMTLKGKEKPTDNLRKKIILNIIKHNL